MIIAHVLSSFGLGGQERVALELAIQQRAAGHFVVAVSLAAPPEGPIAQAFRDAGVRAETVAKTSGVDASLPVRLAGFLRDERVDVVHTHNPHALIYGAPAAGLARAAIVHTKHGANPDVPRRRWLRRVASTLVDACVAVTPALAALARRDRECDPALLHVIPNGIDMARFAPRAEARRRVRATLGIPEKAWVVGTVGRLAPEKNQALLVDAMTPLLDERRQLVIVGDGPEREALKKKVAGTLRGEFVHMPGASANVHDVLAAFDAFALTSTTEGLPLVLLEAMATELPVVSSSVGGIPDVIEHEVTGFLFRSGAEKALTRELVRLVGTPELGRRIGAAGRQAIADSHSVQRMAESYDALYRRVTTGEPPRARAGAGRATGGMTGLALLGIATLLYTYAGYPLLVLAWARLAPLRYTLRDDFEPTVSVCLAVNDGAGYLERKLRSLQALDYPRGKLEILVCSDGSSDETVRIAREMALGDPRIFVFSNPTRLGKPAALNRMRVAAKGEVLLMTDVRQTLHPGALRAMLRRLADPSVGCVSGSLVLDGDTGASAYWRYERFIRGAEARVGGMVGVSGSLYAMRRADLDELPRDVLLDDMFIPLRVALTKKHIVLCDDAEAYDEACDDEREFSRKVRTLAGNYQLVAMLPWLLVPGRNPVWFQIVSHKLLRLVCPWALGAVFVASSVLAFDPELGPVGLVFFRTLTLAQLAFYGLAALGSRAGRLGTLARTFVVLNAAALVGLWRFVRGTQAVTW